jgi:hypothetical protein
VSEHINAMAYVRKGGSDAVASVGRVHGKEKISGVAVSGTRPCVLREYVYVNG